MKKIIKYTIASVLALGLTNCTDSFEDTNTNPYGISYESLTQMFNHIGSSFDPMFLNVVKANPASSYQLQQNLIGDVYSGYMTPPTPFIGNVNNMTYALVDGWNAQPWNSGYNQIMPSALDVKEAVELGGDESGEVFVQLANIIRVAGMHRVTDTYGPIRYSKYEDLDTTGEYDTQETVYNTFFDELAEAISTLEEYESTTQFSSFDMSSFEGDISKWRKFANSLRLRLAMRVVKVDPDLAKEQAELSLTSDVGFLDSDLIINTGYSHPLVTISDSWGDTRMSAEMESFLKGYDDDRIKTFFYTSADTSLDGEYKGIRMGVNIQSKTQYLNHSALGDAIHIETVQWMTVAEIEFLKAEAALRGWSVSGTAQEHYEAGVTASFAQFGVSGAANYLTDNTSTPADFVDAINSENDIAYPSDVKIAYDPTGTNEEQLEQIITQKWIALFPDGQEAWSEFRRTGYPKIFPVVINNSGGDIDTDIQIRRINFVQSEINTNGTNVDIATSYLKGPDNGGTRLWWDVEGSNF